MTSADLFSFTIAFVTSTLIGFFLTSLLMPRFSSALIWALAVPTGIGLCSFIDFLFRRPMFTVEAIVGVVLCALWFWRRGGALKNLAALATYRAPIPGIVFVGVFGWALATTYNRIERTPMGGWDGWAIWNSHARVIYRDPKLWKDHLKNTFHPDYPLLVPFAVVRSWRYVGGDVPGISGLIGLLMTFSGIGVLAAALAERRSLSLAVLIAIVLLSTPSYLIQGAFQEADVPLSVFILSSLTVLFLFFDSARSGPGLLVLAGFLAGCAGWTKNEGLLFILGMSTALLVPVFGKPRLTVRRFGLFLAGLALPLAVIVLFKATIAPQNDLMWNRHYEEIVGRIFDPNRYMMISEELVRQFQVFGVWARNPFLPILAVLLLSGINWRMLRNTGWLTALLTLLLVLIGYYGVYVLTPLDLRYHLDTSMYRLLLHLWPSALLLAGLMLAKSGAGESAPSGKSEAMTVAAGASD